MTRTTLSSSEFASAVEQHYAEAADDMRKVIVGLQQESHEAEVYERYAHLYTSEQLDSLAAERDAATDPRHREELRRLWFDAADAVAAADVVRASQELMNDRLSWRTSFCGQELSINAIGAASAAEPDYDRREQLYELACQANETFASRDLELAVRSSQLRSEVFGLDGEVAIACARTGVDIPAFSSMVNDVATATAERYRAAADLFHPLLLGRDVATPSRGHAAWMRSLHGFDDIYTRERMVDVCERTMSELGFPLDSIPNIHADLDDRPEKDPRACVIPTRVPEDVHLIVRPTGGITDYQAFLHEAGHALHFGLAAADLPFSFRCTAPDNALTEIYSYVVERITHNPLWHQRHFGLSRQRAEEVCEQLAFIDTALFRRYGAKLAYELEFWADPADPRNPDRYAMLLSNATGQRYSTSGFVDDMDPGLYAADYLRAWRTSEQVISWLEGEHGEEWFCSGAAAPMLRELFAQGTLPTNEEISLQVGSSPTSFDDLVKQLA